MSPRENPRHLVLAKARIYPDFVSVFVSNEPMLSSNGQAQPILNAKTNDQSDTYETNEERSLRRTRRTIKDYVLCNDFDLFGTFTIANDRSNIEHSKAKMSNWLKNQRTRNGKFRYIITPEFHKLANALHFHALLGGYKGKISDAINPHTNTQVLKNSKPVFQFDEYNSGFSNAMYIDKDADSKTKVAFYLQKYITKDMPQIFAKNRYWASKGLNKPPIIDITAPWYEYVTPKHIHTIDYGKILYYDRKQVEVFLP